MHPEAKAQIYSVNENLPANQVAWMWGVLDQLERTRGKEKRWRSCRQESKLQVEYICVCWMCFNLYNSRGLICIPHANTILADYGKARFYLKKQKLILKINQHLPNQNWLVPNLLINAEMPDWYQITTDPSAHIATFNLIFLSLTNPLTHAKKRCQQT